MLCEFSNQSLAVLDIGYKPILKVEGGNRITGAIGSCLDEILCPLRKRVCQIVGELDLGSRTVNESGGFYSGVLGLLQSKKVDIYLKGEIEFVEEDWLKKTNVIRSEKIVIGQRISRDVSYYDLMLNFNLGWQAFAYYFGSVLLSVLFFFVLIYVSKRLKQPNRPGLAQTFLSSVKRLLVPNRRFSFAGVFLLSFSLFLYQTRLFLINNIQTNQVVVDTSSIIKNRDDLFQTKRVGCMMNHETEMKLSLSSPNQFLMSKLFYEKTLLSERMKRERKLLKNERCILERDSSLVDLFESEIFLIGTETSSYLAFLFLSTLEAQMDVWYLERDSTGSSIYEFGSVLYYSEKSKINRKIANLHIPRHFESGLITKMYGCMETNSYSAVHKTANIYNSISQIHEDGIKFSHLIMTNFQTIFVSYFAICLTISCAFLVHNFVLLFKRSRFAEFRPFKIFKTGLWTDGD